MPCHALPLSPSHSERTSSYYFLLGVEKAHLDEYEAAENDADAAEMLEAESQAIQDQIKHWRMLLN
jgi:hypothetical protein